ncbi:hypothetical protein Droror1_Dr00026215 [Drosera rotundifolia]
MGEKVAAENKEEMKAAPKNNGGGGGGATAVVMKVDLHCEGCAKKVRRSIKHLDGVESVTADIASNKITVVGDVDPIQVKEKVEEKIKKKVELVSAPPKKNGAGGEKKPEGKSEKKPDEKSEEKKPKEPPVSTVVLSTRVHCDGCAQKIKRIVSKYEGVQDVNVDLQKDVIIVKGTMNMEELLPYLNTKLKRTVDIAPPPKKDGGAPASDKKPQEGGGDKKEGGGDKKEGGGDKKPKEGGEGKKDKDAGGEKKEKEGGGDKKGKEGGEEKKGEAKGAGDGPKPAGGDAPKVEVNKMEYYGTPYGPMAYTYDPSSSYSNNYVVEYSHAPYPPQPQPFHAPYPGESIHAYGSPYMHYQQAPDMFSDENPNASCSIM